MLKIKVKPKPFDQKQREMIMNLVRLRRDANEYILRVAAQMSLRTGLSEEYCNGIVRHDLAKRRAKMLKEKELPE